MEPRRVGIDYLRAIMSVFVVLWHMGAGGRSLIFSKEHYLEHSFAFSDFVNYHVLLLAVPTFIFISIFLYASREISVATLKKRMKRLLVPLVFWPVLFIAWTEGPSGLVAGIPHSLAGWVKIILSGGNTRFFFLTSLLICVIVAHVFLLLGRRAQLALLLCGLGLTISLPYLAKATGFYALGAYWSPLNYVAVTLTAAFFARNEDLFMGKKFMLMACSAALWIVLSILEWKYAVARLFFVSEGSAMPAHARPSMLFAVLFVFLLASSPKLKSYSLVRFMSRYSLGLYCLHSFFIEPVNRLMSAMSLDGMLGIWLGVVVVILASYGVAVVLRRYFLKDELLI